MTIHQMQLRYEPVADRLLLSVRTRSAEMYTAWLTRRMVARLETPLRQAVSRLALPPSAAAAVALAPMPETQQMLEQVAAQRPLKDADFSQAFAGSEGVTHPLGPEPLLPGEIDLTAPPGGGIVLELREPRGRRLEIKLGNDLATALMRLLDQTLQAAQWSLAQRQPTLPADGDADADAPAAPTVPAPPHRLN